MTPTLQVLELEIEKCDDALKILFKELQSAQNRFQYMKKKKEELENELHARRNEERIDGEFKVLPIGSVGREIGLCSPCGVRNLND